jgi:hypothetical protein
MVTGCRMNPAVVRVWLVTAGLVLLGETLFVDAQGEKAPQKLPKGISEITREHPPSKMPNFFYFDYPYEPQPGKRLWLRVDDKHWIERYPDGLESRFKILGRTTIRGQTGTVVVKVEGASANTLSRNKSEFQVFIPDKGTDMAILFRHVGKGNQWRNMSGSENKKTIIQKVE